ncbi:uncharacterized protein EI90DRAFT_3032658 [Cantharellus anzutake]|uniref:uncharacterized protein n=1 Tax=Cantharellus anzutake TaxID=1750568 RepID=UPI0019049B99|nr:uncharacterized protein EI90DRAFT_3032658 [Cantharellus anzutake]KAF8342264.1 hypothetical protein EI90DRAFT_3032658 [Cantharellus anzutake]
MRPQCLNGGRSRIELANALYNCLSSGRPYYTSVRTVYVPSLPLPPSFGSSLGLSPLAFDDNIGSMRRVAGRAVRKYKPASLGIFIHDNRMPYKLWVHPKLEDRDEVLNVIRTNGGIVLPEDKLAPATYAVISDNLSSEDLAPWIFHCAISGKILNDRPYILISRRSSPNFDVEDSSIPHDANESTPRPEVGLGRDASLWWYDRYFGQGSSNAESFGQPVLAELYQEDGVIHPFDARVRSRCSDSAGDDSAVSHSLMESAIFQSSLTRGGEPHTVSSPPSESYSRTINSSVTSPRTPPHSLPFRWITRKNGSRVRKYKASRRNRRGNLRHRNTNFHAQDPSWLCTPAQDGSRRY